MKKVVLKPKSMSKFSLHCPFTNEKLDNEDNSFEIYEGAGNYIFGICSDCIFYDAGNNDEIEKYWKNSHIEAVEKFISDNSQNNILVIEVDYEDETYLYGFLNEENVELSNEEIEKRFIQK